MVIKETNKMGVSVGKLTKYKFMEKNSNLKDYLPNTELLTYKSFSAFLDQYGIVIVKPCIGLRGSGVVQISTLGFDKYQFHFKHKKVEVEGRQQAFTYLSENYLKIKKKYIVQQKIPLATINNCPFDIRVMIQRKTSDLNWKVTGILVKVAAKGFFVTNYAKGVKTLEEAIIASSISKFDSEMVKSELKLIGLETAKTLQEYYKERRRIGLDIGITDSGKLWIIEANLTPTISMFDLLDDKTMYEEIKEYRKG